MTTFVSSPNLKLDPTEPVVLIILNKTDNIRQFQYNFILNVFRWLSIVDKDKWFSLSLFSQALIHTKKKANVFLIALYCESGKQRTTYDKSVTWLLQSTALAPFEDESKIDTIATIMTKNISNRITTLEKFQATWFVGHTCGARDWFRGKDITRKFVSPSPAGKRNIRSNW